MNIIAVHDWVRSFCSTSRKPWQVHSIYRHTVCLNAQERLITISTKGNGPATVFTEEPLPKCYVGQLIHPHALLDGGNYQLWVPPQYSLAETELKAFIGRGANIINYTANSALLTARYNSQLKSAIGQLSACFPNVYPGAQLLIGLGPGLTPAGDDFLTGYCHVLSHAGVTGLWRQLAAISAQTNRVAGEMLYWACQGTVLSFWESALFEAVNPVSNKSAETFKNAAAVGSSSGADYLLGTYVGLSTLAERL